MKQVLYFSAPWCQPCKMLGPLVEQVQNETGVTVTKLNADVDKAEVERYGIRGVPALIFLKDGVEQSRHTGIITKAALTAKFQNL